MYCCCCIAVRPSGSGLTAYHARKCCIIKVFLIASSRFVCRAFASWKEFVALVREKREQLQRASRACFASQLQRAWASWAAHVRRQRLLRSALESRQVCCSTPVNSVDSGRNCPSITCPHCEELASMCKHDMTEAC